MIRVSPALIFLVVAWLCANRPQGIVAEVTQWWSGAGTFSHQAQLAGELRAVLAQAEVPDDAGRTAVAAAPRESPSPAAVAPVSFQRIEFALSEAVRLSPPAAKRGQFVSVPGVAAAQPREVPVPVPRVAIVSS